MPRTCPDCSTSAFDYVAFLVHPVDPYWHQVAGGAGRLRDSVDQGRLSLTSLWTYGGPNAAPGLANAEGSLAAFDAVSDTSISVRSVGDAVLNDPGLNSLKAALLKRRADVLVSISGMNKVSKVRQFTIDESHSNAYTLWLAMGSPQEPTQEQIADLKVAGGLAEITPAPEVESQDGTARFKLTLPRQAVSLITLE